MVSLHTKCQVVMLSIHNLSRGEDVKVIKDVHRCLCLYEERRRAETSSMSGGVGQVIGLITRGRSELGFLKKSTGAGSTGRESKTQRRVYIE